MKHTHTYVLGVHVLEEPNHFKQQEHKVFSFLVWYNWLVDNEYIALTKCIELAT